jgi:shikimate kinase
MQQREDIYMDAADVVINTENVSFGHMYEEIMSQKMR